MKVLFVLFFIKLSVFANDSLTNLFESKDYIILLRHSSSYASYKMEIEKIVESKKKGCISPSKIKEIKEINSKSLYILDKVYDSYNDVIIKSQVYQIKFEIESLNMLLDKMESYYKKTFKCEYNDILKLEKILFRIEVYLKGLSNKISDL